MVHSYYGITIIIIVIITIIIIIDKLCVYMYICIYSFSYYQYPGWLGTIYNIELIVQTTKTDYNYSYVLYTNSYIQIGRNHIVKYTIFPHDFVYESSTMTDYTTGINEYTWYPLYKKMIRIALWLLPMIRISQSNTKLITVIGVTIVMLTNFRNPGAPELVGLI